MAAMTMLITGKKYGVLTVNRDKKNKVNVTPKQIPGKIKGSKTPKDMPTAAELIANTYMATMARSIPTG